MKCAWNMLITLWATEINHFKSCPKPIMSSLFSVRPCYNTTPRPLTACNSEASGINFSSLYNSAASCIWFLSVFPQHTIGEPSPKPPCILFSGWIVGAGAPDHTKALLCLWFLWVKDVFPILGPCLEMSNILKACLVLIISFSVCDWCLPAWMYKALLCPKRSYS